MKNNHNNLNDKILCKLIAIEIANKHEIVNQNYITYMEEVAAKVCDFKNQLFLKMMNALLRDTQDTIDGFKDFTFPNDEVADSELTD